jgi:hypothetical protein
MLTTTPAIEQPQQPSAQAQPDSTRNGKDFELTIQSLRRGLNEGNYFRPITSPHNSNRKSLDSFCQISSINSSKFLAASELLTLEDITLDTINLFVIMNEQYIKANSGNRHI